MSQGEHGRPARAGHRDLLGRPTVGGIDDDEESATASLLAGLDRADPWAIASAVVQGDEPVQTAATLLAWSGQRGGHDALLTSRVLADGLRTATGIDHKRRLVPMAQVAALTAELQVGAGARAEPVARAAGLEEAVRAGDPVAAVDAVRKRCEDGATGAAMERAIIALLYEHAALAGHLAPFVAAACELRDACGDRAIAALHGTLAGRLALAVSVSPSPDLTAHLARAAPLNEALAAVHAAEQPERAAAFNEPRFRRHLLDGRADAALKAVHKALAYGIPRDLVARSLALAAAERVLRFDAAIARRADRREGWPDVGWLLSQASAIRQLRLRLDTPGWLYLLAHGVYLVHGAADLDAPERSRFVLPEPEALAQTWDHGPEIGRITGRIQAGDGEGAIAALRGYLLLALPEQPLCAQLAELLFEDLAGRPDEQANLIVTGCAAIEEFNALAGHPHRELLLCAAIRRVTAPGQPRVAASAAARLLGGRAATSTTPLPWADR